MSSRYRSIAGYSGRSHENLGSVRGGGARGKLVESPGGLYELDTLEGEDTSAMFWS
jgi:hypothetical protein